MIWNTGAEKQNKMVTKSLCLASRLGISDATPSGSSRGHLMGKAEEVHRQLFLWLIVKPDAGCSVHQCAGCFQPHSVAQLGAERAEAGW